MIPYIAIFIIISICAYLDLFQKYLTKEAKFILLTIIYIILTLFLGTRTNGPDYLAYYYHYLYLRDISSVISNPVNYFAHSHMEPGFEFFESFSKSIGLQYEGFLLLLSSIYLYIFFVSFRKYTTFTFVPILVFLAFSYMTCFSAIRQSMASAIFFFSLQHLQRNRNLKYFLLIILATLFHYSAFILVIYIFIKNKYINSLVIFIALVISIIMSLFAVWNAIILKFLGLIPFLSKSKIELYLSVIKSGGLFGSVSITWVLLILLCLILRKKLQNRYTQFNLFFNVLWTGAIIYFVAAGLGDFGRVALYFKVAIIVIIPQIISIFKYRREQFAFITITIIMSGLLYFAVILGDSRYVKYNRFIPYRTWLMK